MERRKESVRRTAAREAVYIEPETGGAAGRNRERTAGAQRIRVERGFGVGMGGCDRRSRGGRSERARELGKRMKEVEREEW
jgi:hypothetical protein